MVEPTAGGRGRGRGDHVASGRPDPAPACLLLRFAGIIEPCRRLSTGSATDDAA